MESRNEFIKMCVQLQNYLLLQQDAMSLKMHLSREVSTVKASSSSKVQSRPEASLSSILLWI